MKTMLRTIFTASVLLGSATAALAARKVTDDGSMLLVWAFLGMCALIVILQVIPLAILFFGSVKALFKEKAEQPSEVVVDK